MIKHSQYFTSDNIASILIRCISKVDVRTILDLGAGEGSLVNTAHNKWKDAKCVVADIDENNHLCLTDQGFDSRNIDCVIPDLSEKLEICYESIDVGVCNPPYETIDNNEYIEELFKKAHLCVNRHEKTTTSDLVFLAYNLLFLKPQGVLGMIVPYSIMTGRNFESIRRSLLDNYFVERVVELPEKSFAYTEAKTGVLIIRKEKCNGRKTKLNTVIDGNRLSASIYASSSILSLRLDYSYHFWKKGQIMKKFQCGNTISIVRGRYSHDDLKKKGLPYFHTTCYNRDDIDWHFNYDESEKSIMSHGSFLIARVGKRCVGRAIYLEEGHIQISDCIYGLTVPKDYIEDYKRFFQSEEYSEFIKIVSRGVCSLYLCKGDLESMVMKKLDEFKFKKRNKE